MGWKILNGKCQGILKNLPSSSVDCCVTSPPYWGLRDYKSEDQLGLEPTPEEYVRNITDIFDEIRRLLKPTGTLWLNLGDTYYGGGNNRGNTKEVNRKQKSNRGAGSISGIGFKGALKQHAVLKPKDLVGIPWRVAFALQERGWYLRQDIIWSKSNAMPESVQDRCTKSHEYLFLLSKSPRYYFDNDAIKEPVAESTIQRLSQDIEGQQGSSRIPGKTNGPMKAVFGGRNKHAGYGTRLHSGREDDGSYLEDGRNKRSVWTVSTACSSDAHFAVFPEKLIEPCILAGCPADGLVLDPFCGSGTTGIVTLKHNRNFIGIELNPEYVNLARSKIISDAPLFNHFTEEQVIKGASL